jgi:hypothetical protein
MNPKLMNSVKTTLLFFLTMFVFISCQKEDDSVYDVNSDDLKEDTGISRVHIEAYVQRVYIDVLGRKPDNVEFDKAVDDLAADDVSLNSRETLVAALLSMDEYKLKLYAHNKSEHLNGVEDNVIQRELQQAIAIRNLYLQQGNKTLADLFEERALNLEDLLAIPNDLVAGTISHKEMHKRIVLNSIYDDINMGVANFTFAVFEGFLFRAPTIDEWETSRNMCNNANSVLFGQNGNTKEGFVDIVFGTDHYYEGQVISAYVRYLGRRPDSVEQNEHTIALAASNNFESFYNKILSGDEYFGI